MRPARLWRLARGNLARELGALLVSAGGVALGIGCLVFFLAMGRGVRKVVGDVFPVSTREVEVVVPQVGIGSFLGEMKLDEALVARLRALPGVAAAYPRLALRIPAVTRYNGLFFGRELHMGLELVGSGVPADLVAGDARMPFADEGEGWRMVEDGATQMDGDLPVNMSGGVLSSNPIGASGTLRFAEAAMQVRGQAGEHQIDGAKVALGHAYGGGSQFFAMWVVGSEQP